MPAATQELTGFGLYARRKRKQRGWNQLELATRMDVNQGTVSNMENGQMPNALTVVKWTASLGLDPREVFAVLAGAESIERDDEDAPDAGLLERAEYWWQSRPDMQADYEWAKSIMADDKFEQFIANTFSAWESNWRMALSQVRLMYE